MDRQIQQLEGEYLQLEVMKSYKENELREIQGTLRAFQREERYYKDKVDKLADQKQQLELDLQDTATKSSLTQASLGGEREQQVANGHLNIPTSVICEDHSGSTKRRISSRVKSNDGSQLVKRRIDFGARDEIADDSSFVYDTSDHEFLGNRKKLSLR